MPFGLCNATSHFPEIDVTSTVKSYEKNGNLVLCFVHDVAIATPTLEDHIER